MSHCTTPVVYLATCYLHVNYISEYTSPKKKNCNLNYDDIVIYVPSTNVPLKFHIYATYVNFFMCIYENTYISIYASYNFNIFQQTCLSHHTHMPNCTNKVVYMWTQLYSTYKFEKKNASLFTMLQPCICQQQICSSNARYISHMLITAYVDMRQLSVLYVSYENYCNLHCGQKQRY